MMKYLRVLTGTINTVPYGNNLNIKTLHLWELRQRIIRDYIYKSEFDIWYWYSNNFSKAQSGDFEKRPLYHDDDLVRKDQKVVAEFDIKTGRVQIYILIAEASQVASTPVHDFIYDNKIPTFGYPATTPFQVDPFQYLLFKYQTSVEDQLETITNRLEKLQKLTPSNIQKWRLLLEKRDEP